MLGGRLQWMSPCQVLVLRVVVCVLVLLHLLHCLRWPIVLQLLLYVTLHLELHHLLLLLHNLLRRLLKMLNRHLCLLMLGAVPVLHLRHQTDVMSIEWLHLRHVWCLHHVMHVC